jgi:hypothetical protein
VTVHGQRLAFLAVLRANSKEIPSGRSQRKLGLWCMQNGRCQDCRAQDKGVVIKGKIHCPSGKSNDALLRITSKRMP